MDKVNRPRVVVYVLLLVAAMLIARPAFAQIDFSGEWAVKNHEDCLTNSCQPPLGDYLGTPLNAAGRLRAETSAESIWGIPEYQCRPHSPAHQWRGVGVSHSMVEIDGPRDLSGWPAASAGMGPAHMDRLFDGKVGGEHSGGHDHAS